jgi:Family of unknown function (DUF5996)
MSSNTRWPPLPYSAWKSTCETLHLWTQIVGKIRLALTPWLNHSWHVPLYVTARGLSTSAIPYTDGYFDIRFDFIDQTLDVDVSTGRRKRIRLMPQSVCDFYAAVMTSLADLGIEVHISERPCEIPNAISFSEDRLHASYDPDAAQRFWRALLEIDRVFKKFRTGFIGKASPVHFFWGSFDLAVTRFSGRLAPPFTSKVPGLSTRVMAEAYSREVSSAGFWPGGGGIDYASFYSYAYPTPHGFKDAPVSPEGAFFDEKLGEFLLPYEEVRNAADPEAALLSFLQSTYEGAAEAAHWDRALLETPFT